MAGPGYYAPETFQQDETFEFSWQLGSGAEPFPWTEYAHEYALAQGGSQVFQLAEGSGIALDPDQHLVTFSKPNHGLCAGEYEHGYRIRHLTTGHVIPVFDGPVTITEGPFR